MPSSIEKLEREATETRHRLDADLQELRRRATPGHVLDEAVDYLRDSGGADFVRNLGDQVRSNPLPTVMLGMSMAWLMFGRYGSHRDGTDGGGKRVDETLRQARETSADLTAATGEFANSAADSVARYADATTEAAARLSEGAKSTYRRTMQGADQMTGKLGEAGAGIAKMIQDQPLIVAGLGLAIGAAIGAALPLTETENRVMGDTARDLAERGREFIGQAQSAASQSVHKDEDVAGPGGFSSAQQTPSSEVAEQY